jgi:hypothetical protein
MNIQCVTKQQQELLNEIWACDDQQDLLELIETVEPEYRQEVLLLSECVFLAHLDEEVESERDCAEARRILQQY